MDGLTTEEMTDRIMAGLRGTDQALSIAIEALGRHGDVEALQQMQAVMQECRA